MTPAERMAAEARLKEIDREIETLRRERIDLRGRLIRETAEWLEANARLSAFESREERGAADRRARHARRANRDPNPVAFNEAHEDRMDRETA